MAHYVDARYDDNDCMFLPPLRTLGFNPQLTMNDSLLVQSYIEAYDISYPEALRRIEAEVAELRQHLEAEGAFELNDIGMLRLNSEGHLLFTPCEAGILTPSLYGLGSFEMEPLAVPEEKKEPQTLTAEKPTDHAITIKMSWLRNVAAVAAAVIAFLMIGTPISNSVDNKQMLQSAFIPLPALQAEPEPVAPQPAAPVSEATVEKAVGEKAASEKTAAVEEAPAAPEETAIITDQNPYTIVLASQVSLRNAETFVGQLGSKGFTEASILEGKFRRVVYGRFATNEEASQQLRQLRKQNKLFGEAWVMKIHNK